MTNQSVWNPTETVVCKRKGTGLVNGDQIETSIDLVLPCMTVMQVKPCIVITGSTTLREVSKDSTNFDITPWTNTCPKPPNSFGIIHRGTGLSLVFGYLHNNLRETERFVRIIWGSLNPEERVIWETSRCPREVINNTPYKTVELLKKFSQLNWKRLPKRKPKNEKERSRESNQSDPIRIF